MQLKEPRVAQAILKRKIVFGGFNTNKFGGFNSKEYLEDLKLTTKQK